MEKIDDRFRADRYTDPELRREGLFTDRKAEIPCLQDNPENRCTYIRHMIALANMSYRYGRVSRFLFGIDDNYKLYVSSDGRKEGVKNQSTNPKFLKGMDYEDEKKVENLFHNIENDFDDLFTKYVDPSLVDMNMQHGYVTDPSGKEFLVAYLEIRAIEHAHLYQLNQTIVHKKDQIIKGTAWRRIASHDEVIKIDYQENWFCWTDCPVLHGSQWKRYFETLQSGDFSIANMMAGHQELHAEGGGLLKEKVNQFLAPDNQESLLVIVGRAGFGKTVFLRRLVYEYAEEAEKFIIDLYDDQPPGAIIPVYREMRDLFFRADDRLDNNVLRWWNKGLIFGKINPPKIHSLLKGKDTRWVICLDALDEMDSWSVRNFYYALNEFLQDYSEVNVNQEESNSGRIKVIITTRPDTINQNWEEHHQIVCIDQLSDRDITSYLLSTISGPDEQEQAIRYLDADPELKEIVRIPLYLFSYKSLFDLETTEIEEPGEEEETGRLPTRAHIYNQIINRIIKHDEKHLREPKSPISSSLAQYGLYYLAAEVDGRQIFYSEQALRRIKRQFYLNRYISMGLLQNLHNANMIFPIRAFQCFMAAEHLSRLWDIQRKNQISSLVNRDDFWEKVYTFINEPVYDPELCAFLRERINQQQVANEA